LCVEVRAEEQQGQNDQRQGFEGRRFRRPCILRLGLAGDLFDLLGHQTCAHEFSARLVDPAEQLLSLRVDKRKATEVNEQRSILGDGRVG